MSSTANNDAALNAILALLTKMDGRISSLESAKPSAPAAAGGGKAKKEKKAKDPSAPKRAPTAWRLFADRVRSVLKDNGFSGVALGTECVQFCSSLKEENADLDSWTDVDIVARRSAWTKPEVSKGEAKFGKNWVKNKSWRKTPEGSVVSGAADEADGEAADGGAAPAKKARKNPWANLSEAERAERIAKMKAGKAAKKAVSEGLLDDEPLGTSLEEAAAAVAKTKAALAKAKTEAAPAPKEAPKPSAGGAGAAAAASSAAAAPSDEFKPILLSGSRYLVNMSNGHAYHRVQTGPDSYVQGEWAGIFSKVPKPHIDDSVPEPGAEEDDGYVEE